jgi:uncharacterized protein YndB with AHSA1/START domain
MYVVYIATTPEEAWKALIEGEITRQYWGHQNVSDWKAGSRWEHRRADGTGAPLIVGKVLEVKPPRRLVVTWVAPEDEANTAKHTRVTFEIEPIAKMIRLTVTHDELEAGSDMQRGITEGWPRVLSSMKSFLETGRALDTWAKAGR